MNCPNCNKEILPDKVFCNWCEVFIPNLNIGGKAGIFRRWFATAIDYLLGIILFFLNLYLTGSLKSLRTIIIIAYSIFFLWLLSRGITPGKWILGEQVVNKLNGNYPGFWRMVLREIIGKFISSLFLGLGYFWAIWDKDNQAWHDKIAGTVVILKKKIEYTPPIIDVSEDKFKKQISAPKLKDKVIDKDNVPYKEKAKEVQFLSRKAEASTKNCPFCQEEIIANATICKYCGEYIETKVKAADLPPKQEEQPKPKIFSEPKAPVDFSKEQKIPPSKSIAEKETYIPQPSSKEKETMIFTGAKLVIQGGAMDGKSFPIVAITTTIGRRENKVISIDEPTLSRDHASLTMEGDKFILKNESKLGTKVNGVAIESIELKYGDVIQMGAIKIMFNKEA